MRSELLSYQNQQFGRGRAFLHRMTASEKLADLYFRLEQINRTIAALERFARLRARRQARLERLPSGRVRDALTRDSRSATTSCIRTR